MEILHLAEVQAHRLSQHTKIHKLYIRSTRQQKEKECKRFNFKTKYTIRKVHGITRGGLSRSMAEVGLGLVQDDDCWRKLIVSEPGGLRLPLSLTSTIIITLNMFQ